jgi:ketosteroid isomerase-like protein
MIDEVGEQRRNKVRPSELPDLYFSSVQARDIDRFISLFAKDAVMILPDGNEVLGVAAIRKMELTVFESSSPPSPTPVSIIAGKDSVAVEIDVRLPSGQVLKMASFFQLNGEGLIRRLSIYRKGDR